MSVSAIVSNARLRLLIAAAAVLLLLGIYLPAEAGAKGFHDFYGPFAHPWGSFGLSWCVLALCVIALVATGPLLRGGSWLRRIAAVAISIFPLLILARYVVWLAQQLGTE